MANAIEKTPDEEKPKVNHSKLQLYVFALGMFYFQVAWTMAGNNQPGRVVRVKLGFSEEEWNNTYNRLVTSAGILGMTVGGPFATVPM